MMHDPCVAHLKDGRRIQLFADPCDPVANAHLVYAFLSGKEIGRMTIELPNGVRRAAGVMHNPPGSIRRVDVLPEYRRQGVATAMWHCAKQAGFNPNHGGQQTDDGRAWASTVGRYSVPRKRTLKVRISELRVRTKDRPW